MFQNHFGNSDYLTRQTRFAFSHEAKFETEAEAVEALELLSDRATITQVSSEKKSKTAPKLYNLTDIQAEMSKLYKFDADRTKSYHPKSLSKRLYVLSTDKLKSYHN